MWLAMCFLLVRAQPRLRIRSLGFSSSKSPQGVLGLCMEYFSSQSKRPKRPRWKLCYLLWLSLGSSITTFAIPINLQNFKKWEPRFHLSMESMSKKHFEKRMQNGRHNYGQLRKYNLSHCPSFLWWPSWVTGKFCCGLLKEPITSW